MNFSLLSKRLSSEKECNTVFLRYSWDSCCLRIVAVGSPAIFKGELMHVSPMMEYLGIILSNMNLSFLPNPLWAETFFFSNKTLEYKFSVWSSEMQELSKHLPAQPSLISDTHYRDSRDCGSVCPQTHLYKILFFLSSPVFSFAINHSPS